ncbi:LysM peptidoglycan-binding domain-containing protein [Schaalia sp. lx-260]|uniref:LysM peptidoglycan-binding domain-containing protein n=1 Tax=Schaalia sp. lx-260 TaxID=2899082 RepID=UPI001E4E0167|nr:LysM peptidoglycan-binding domain-containing protein [Schaalia sp. lx-260]MCD4549226.1 LysM peptidoglycan-binding domain-containing protein [Schaalia sp. lx-260]
MALKAYEIATEHDMRVLSAGDMPLATVSDIRMAPSRRRVRRALRSENPAAARRPHPPRTRAIRQYRFSALKVGAAIFGTVIASVCAAHIGFALQPDISHIPTSVHLVRAGDSVWSLAATVPTSRPLEEVVTDIERLNPIDGTLLVGQTIALPRYDK